jgi:hypothetical protein
VCCVLGGTGFAGASCSTLECGEGTLEVDGTCRAPDDRVRCGAGFEVKGSICVPTEDWIKEYCDPDTAEVRDGKCVGTGGAQICTERCPAANDKICVSGQVVDMVSLLTKGPKGATPIAKSAGLMVRIYDPFAFLSSPTPTPLGEAPVNNENGCFVVPDIVLPALGLVAGVLEDDTGTRYARVVLGMAGTAGENLENNFVPVMTPAQVAAWDQDAFDKGALGLWFIDEQGAPVAGVKPLLNGGDIPTVRFVAADASKIDDTATTTTASGLVLIPSAGFGSYSGEKAGCKIAPNTGGSAAGSYFIVPWPVTECQ